MNKLILSMLLLLSAHAAYGQCKLYSKKDDFNGSVVYWTKPVKIASDGVGVLAGQFDCTFKVFVHFVYGKGKTVLVLTEKGAFCGGCVPSSVTFKLTNDTVLTKTNLRQGSERSGGIGESEQRSLFVLTEDELALLSSQEIVKFRIREAGCTDHPMIESEMPGKAAGQIRESASCVREKAR